ncbi:MAG: transcription termination/antitermination protein NusA, partial [Nitrospirae bacterium]|nr:transcription termination/antitermination protein NusA [Nitrospirota bacterium]
MNRELISVIEQIGREKGINSRIIIGAVESALQTAARKRFGGMENIQVQVDPKTGEIQVISIKKIVEHVTNPGEELALEDAIKIDPESELGDEVGALIDVGDFGR